MISKITGFVSLISENTITVDIASGISYNISTTKKDLSRVVIDENITVFCHQTFKEDMQALYGFLEYEDLLWFKSLLKVSGLGAKTALNFLSFLTSDDIINAINSGDVALISKTPGLGKKTAIKLIAELEKAPLKIKTQLADTVFGSNKYTFNLQNQSSNVAKNNHNQAIEKINKNTQNKESKKEYELDKTTEKEPQVNKNEIFSQAIAAMESLGFNRSQVYKEIMELQRQDGEISLDELIKQTLKKMST